MFSQRTCSERSPNSLTQLLLRLQAEGREILDLTRSNPTSAGIPYPPNLLQVLADPRAFTYQPSAVGDPTAREAVAQTWLDSGIALPPSQILLTASTSEAYSFLFKLLVNPGEEVLIPEPSYPLFEHLARLDAVVLRPYRLAYDGAWHVDLDSVRRAVSPQTRAILVVHPNNPTGNYLKPAEFQFLADLGIPIISDEVFSSYALATERKWLSSALAHPGARVFGLGGLSKLAGLPQLKAAWIGVQGPKPWVEEAMDRLELIADTYLSVATPVQLALPHLLAQRQLTEGAIRDRTRANWAWIRAACAGTEITVLTAEGGWYAVLHLPQWDDRDWAAHLLEKESVLVQPGWFYDFPDEGYVIVSLLTPPEALNSGIERLIEAVRCG